MKKSQIGLIGLGVMGANLARNIANKGFKCSVYNRSYDKTEEFIANFGNENLEAHQDLKDFVASLAKPRKIIIMVKAGDPVDMVIESIKPYLEKDDIIIDCGNEKYQNTQRRINELTKNGLKFIGCGVSGGEEGALHGPSMMPGGDKQSWEKIKDIFEAISARDFNNKPCVTYIGDNGAGHYVKMVHNGIEYALMQMMAESYELFRSVYNLNASDIARIFEKYNEGKLKSYLFEIAVEVLDRKDEFNDGYLIDYILDKAGQKGTGKWTGIDALDRGITLPSITEAVFARTASAQKTKRVHLAQLYTEKAQAHPLPKLEETVIVLEHAVYAAMLSAYAQGYDLIQSCAIEENWDVDMGEVSRTWEGGCIIRAEILNTLHQAYLSSKNNKSLHIFELATIQKDLKQSMPALRQLISLGIRSSIPMPSLTTALSYFDTMTNSQSPANLIQGLRDYFGAHTYQRTDREGVFHTEWN